MREGADNRRAGWTSLLTMGVVAAAVLAVALFVSGARTGTIVFQRVVQRFPGNHRGAARFAVTIVAETSADGTFEHLLIGNAQSQPLESLDAGSSFERYIPQDNTVYAVTLDAYAAAYARYMHRPDGRSLRAHFRFPTYAGTWVAPGSVSFFKRQLEAGNYRLAGRTTINGRQALKLVPVHSIIPSRRRPLMTLQTAYVSPRSYDPIEQTLIGATTTVWIKYRVLPDTAANHRLVSLTAQHPGARISHSASAYVRALFQH